LCSIAALFIVKSTPLQKNVLFLSEYYYYCADEDISIIVHYLLFVELKRSGTQPVRNNRTSRSFITGVVPLPLLLP
jgi:hypothetical protein